MCLDEILRPNILLNADFLGIIYCFRNFHVGSWYPLASKWILTLHQLWDWRQSQVVSARPLRGALRVCCAGLKNLSRKAKRIVCAPVPTSTELTRRGRSIKWIKIKFQSAFLWQNLLLSPLWVWKATGMRASWDPRCWNCHIFRLCWPFPDVLPGRDTGHTDT